tara:strand:- start:50812 stop:51057 length:246 start_codon:yes stop_codon:yes gene_type:complete
MYAMPVTPELNAEIKILNLYNLDSQMEGLKVHKDADNETRDAIARLHAKGLLTQTDGGYLTDLGVHCAEHIQTALRILATR